MKIAIIGSGISGNVVAHHLYREHDITLFERTDYVGGHTHTHDIEFSGERHQIDTGFIVFNDWTYPNFVQLLNELGVESQATEMSFSVRNHSSGLEYNGSNLDTLFAQRKNLLRPAFYKMIAEIVRFSREAPKLLETSSEISLGDYLFDQGYGAQFIGDYLVPMGAAIWSTDPSRMLSFPAQFFVRFFHNHGMLSIDERPVWRVVTGGSRQYVDRLVSPFRDRIKLGSAVEWVQRWSERVLVKCRGEEAERFDHVFIACHADQALKILADPSEQERKVLGAFSYQSNEAVLHTDISLLPVARKAWAAWNYQVGPKSSSAGTSGATLTYNMNILQNLKSDHTFCVSLNRSEDIDPAKILKRVNYEHPLYTRASIAAQRAHSSISGVNQSHFCGAYWGYGFHEDGVKSSLDALRGFERQINA